MRSVWGVALVGLAMLLDTGPIGAQSPYALIGTDEMVQADHVWAPGQSAGDRYRAIMDAWAEDDGFSGGVLIAHEGEVVFEGAYGLANREFGVPNTHGTRYRAGFLSYFFTATLIGVLADEGYLDLSDRLDTHLTELSPDVGRVTIAQLLDNASGLEQDVFRYLDRDQFDQFEGFHEFVEIVDLVERRGEPGSISPYGTAAVSLDYNLLGAVVERVTGNAFENVMRDRLIRGLGLRDTGFHTGGVLVERLASNYQEVVGEIVLVDRPNYSYTRAFGAMYTTPRDFFALASFVHGPLGTENMRLAYGVAGGGPRALRFDDGTVSVVSGSEPGSGEVRRYVDSNGWIQGETSQLGHFVDDGHLLVVMSNMHRAAVIYDLRRRWARTVVGLGVGRPEPRVRSILWRTLRDEGLEAAAAFYARVAESGEGVDLPWPDEFMNYSRYLRGRSRFAEAVAITELYIRTQPDFYLPYREMGEVYRAMGVPSEAVRYFRQALAREPDHPAWRADMESYVAEHGGRDGP